MAKGKAVCSILALFALAFPAVLALANDSEIIIVMEDNATSINDRALIIAVDEIPTASLTDDETHGLLYMAEEEKLAGDVYDTLNQRWNLRVFTNIEKAERTHEAAVKTLLSRYGLEDPTINEVGRFNNADLQQAYDQLVSRGNSSVQNALEVGAEIEEMDIRDLQKEIAQTDKADIRLVYENLMAGSKNHLRAFVSNLQRQGFYYEPRYLEQSEYSSIVRGEN